MKKILVLLGNPDADTFSGKLAETYALTAKEKGYHVERLDISELDFDPILHCGYTKIQELEPDLVMLQEKIKWADHLVIIYPNWWCTMPAVLKGMFDRMWLPGFAFNFDKENGGKLIQRFKGKTARIIIVAGTYSPFRTWLKFGDFTNEISHGILGFSGIKAKVTAFGPSNKVKDALLEKWILKVKKLAERGL